MLASLVLRIVTMHVPICMCICYSRCTTVFCLPACCLGRMLIIYTIQCAALYIRGPNTFPVLDMRVPFGMHVWGCDGWFHVYIRERCVQILSTAHHQLVESIRLDKLSRVIQPQIGGPSKYRTIYCFRKKSLHKKTSMVYIARRNVLVDVIGLYQYRIQCWNRTSRLGDSPRAIYIHGVYIFRLRALDLVLDLDKFAAVEVWCTIGWLFLMLFIDSGSRASSYWLRTKAQAELFLASRAHPASARSTSLADTALWRKYYRATYCMLEWNDMILEFIGLQPNSCMDEIIAMMERWWTTQFFVLFSNEMLVDIGRMDVY